MYEKLIDIAHNNPQVLRQLTECFNALNELKDKDEKQRRHYVHFILKHSPKNQSLPFLMEEPISELKLMYQTLRDKSNY